MDEKRDSTVETYGNLHNEDKPVEVSDNIKKQNKHAETTGSLEREDLSDEVDEPIDKQNSHIETNGSIKSADKPVEVVEPIEKQNSHAETSGSIKSADKPVEVDEPIEKQNSHTETSGSIEKDEEIIEVNGNDKDKSQVVLHGSFEQSYAVDTLVAYAARSGIIALNMPVYFGMTKLNTYLKSLLIISPLISTMYSQIPMTWSIHRTGGKTEGLAMIGATLTGMATLTTLFAATDISTIDRFDWRYGIALGGGFLIGHGSAASQLIIDSFKWVPKKKYIPNLQLLHSFLVDTSSITTPIITYFLGTFGYYTPFSIYTGITLIGGALALTSFPSPYNQLKSHYSKERARELAIESGQLPELIGEYDTITLRDMVRENLTVLLDRRSLLLCFSIFTTIGSFFVSRTILPNLLTNGFGLSAAEAVVTTSIANLLTILARPLASKAIEKWDHKSGGVAVHLLGSALTVAGTTTLAVGKLSKPGLYASLAATNLGFGVSMVAPLSIATKWSKSEEGSLTKVNPSTMFGLFSTLGSLGGIIFPLLLSLLIDESGSQWYKQYFYIIMALMIASAIGVPVVNYQVRKKGSCCPNPFSFFGNSKDVQTVIQDVSAQAREIDPEAGAVDSDDDIYLEAII